MECLFLYFEAFQYYESKIVSLQVNILRVTEASK